MDVDGFLGRIRGWVWLLLLVVVVMTTWLVVRLGMAMAGGFIPLIPVGVVGVWMATKSTVKWWNRVVAHKEAKITDYDAEFADLLNGKYD